MKFYPYEKGGGEGVLAILKWGGGGRKTFPLFKRGHFFYPVLRGGGQKVSDPRFTHFVVPLPVINDQSLIEHDTILFCSVLQLFRRM